jgi:c-di-GMP-binding flagellar brake protein YcgR
MTYGGPERRRYKRIRKPYMVRFKPHDDAEARWDMVAVLNFGAGGALFYYNSKVDEAQILDIKINFSSSKEAITCQGKVIRCESVPAGMYLIAVNFVGMDELQQEYVNKTIEDIMSEE